MMVSLTKAVSQAIIDVGTRCSLTRAVLEEWSGKGTPKMRKHLLEFLQAEADSRDAARRARLLGRAHIPVMKSLDGFDWSYVTLPEDFGRDDVTSLSFVDAREDLVLMGDVGTGKTHMAQALAASMCMAGREARFFTAVSLVQRLRKANADGRLDRELAAIGRAELVVLDELGYLPLDEEGAKLLFLVVSQAYERQSVVFTTNLEFSLWGTVFGDDQMAAAVIDRVVHHGRILRFRGQSWRVTHSLMNGRKAA